MLRCRDPRKKKSEGGDYLFFSSFFFEKNKNRMRKKIWTTCRQPKTREFWLKTRKEIPGSQISEKQIRGRGIAVTQQFFWPNE